jgi:hypothetical protein
MAVTEIIAASPRAVAAPLASFRDSPRLPTVLRLGKISTGLGFGARLRAHKSIPFRVVGEVCGAGETTYSNATGRDDVRRGLSRAN